MITLVDQTVPVEEGESFVDRLLEDTLGRLHGGSGTVDLETALTAFAEAAVRLNPLQCKLARVGAIRGLDDMKVKGAAGLVDAALDSVVCPIDAVDGKAGSQIVLADVEPADDPVDGHKMLEEIIARFLRHIVMPYDLALTAALWDVFAHCHDAFGISPILAYQSPEKRCGKSNSLIIHQCLVPRPLLASNLNPANIYRIINEYSPTLLLDEADTYITAKDKLMVGILDSGHVRATAQVPRSVGEEHDQRMFSTWAPKVVASIRGLPDQLQDRSIILWLRRRAPGEKITRLRWDTIHQELEPLRRKLARWALDHRDALVGVDPSMPDGLNDRAQDNWRPLLAVADRIGLASGDLARRAALRISGETSEEGTASELLLADIRDLFDSRGNRLASEDIIEALVKMEDRPWPEWYHGNPMTKPAMARQLKRFDWTDKGGKIVPIRPKMIRIGTETVRGYKREWFEDAFTRYLPPQTATPATPPENPGVSPDSDRNKPPTMLRSGNGEKPARMGHVAGVAVQPGGTALTEALLEGDLGQMSFLAGDGA